MEGSKMSVMVTVEFKLKPDAAEGFLEAMKSTLPDTRAFEGCQEVKTYYESETQSLLLVELWDSAEHQQTYLGWRVETGMMEAIGDALAGAPVFRTFEIRDDI
ncbi:MAG: antibiotic biosynthesis monooxygenase [Rhodobiaceae bacterium]|nr:antibiotic biosynthesis monooxygenase [Rhodobiaceae bacterium]|tara:strand:- start:466 stop:774 length:309 start_codon:yes stop_codon:yes gene_type:complete